MVAANINDRLFILLRHWEIYKFCNTVSITYSLSYNADAVFWREYGYKRDKTLLDDKTRGPNWPHLAHRTIKQFVNMCRNKLLLPTLLEIIVMLSVYRCSSLVWRRICSAAKFSFWLGYGSLLGILITLSIPSFDTSIERFWRKYASSLWYRQLSTTVVIRGPIQTKSETRCSGGVTGGFKWDYKFATPFCQKFSKRIILGLQPLPDLLMENHSHRRIYPSLYPTMSQFILFG